MYDDDGPIQSGIGYYGSHLEALQEAREWAVSENYPMEAQRLEAEISNLELK